VKKLRTDRTSFAREADQDRCQGRQSRSLRDVPDGGGRDPTTVIRFDHAENCRFAIAPNGYGNMSTPATVHAGKTTGEVRPYHHAARLLGAQQADARLTSCRTDGPACLGRRKLPESSGFDSNRRVMWGIPDELGSKDDRRIGIVHELRDLLGQMERA
jgi:hypothetical protein